MTAPVTVRFTVNGHPAEVHCEPRKTLADVLRILTDGPEFFSERLKDFITVFDPIEDKGHEFGYGRTEAEKRALIEFLKTL